MTAPSQTPTPSQIERLCERLEEGRALCEKIGLADASIYGEAKRTIESLAAQLAEALEVVAASATDFIGVRDAMLRDPFAREKLGGVIEEIGDTGEWLRTYVSDAPSAVKDLANRADKAEAAAASARETALEEAAKVCESRMTCGCGRDDCYTDRIPEDMAERIRALKSTPAPVTPSARNDDRQIEEGSPEFLAAAIIGLLQGLAARLSKNDAATCLAAASEIERLTRAPAPAEAGGYQQWPCPKCGRTMIHAEGCPRQASGLPAPPTEREGE